MTKQTGAAVAAMTALRGMAVPNAASLRPWPSMLLTHQHPSIRTDGRSAAPRHHQQKGCES